MPTIALLGAGGKMGVRLAKNLKGSRFEVRHVEVSEAGRERLRSEGGLACMDQAMRETGVDEALRQRLNGSFFQTADWMRNRGG